MTQRKLYEAVNEWHEWRATAIGIKQNQNSVNWGTTSGQDEVQIRKLKRTVGDIYCHNITTTHITQLLQKERRNSAGSFNNTLRVLRSFFEFCRLHSYIPKNLDPVGGIRTQRVGNKVKRYVPASDFPALLDAAKSPRDRILLALGMYLLCRQSEIRYLTLDDVDLERGRILVTIVKKSTDQDLVQVLMPISSELEKELRDWLTIYATMAGPLQPHWRLVPGTKMMTQRRPHLATGGFSPVPKDQWMSTRVILPENKVDKPEKIAQYALEAIGYSSRGADGKSLYLGMHTLRRSSARAMYDRLSEGGYDGAIRMVQSFLNHKSIQMTELYIGLTLDDKKRDEMFRGRDMFPVARENVVELKAVSDGN